MGKWTVNSNSLIYLSFSIPFPCSPGHRQWWVRYNHTDCTLTAPSAKLASEVPPEGNCPGQTWDAANANVLRAKPSYLHTCLHMLSTYLHFLPVSATDLGINRSQHRKSSLTSVQSYISLTFIIMTFVSKSVKHEINFENHSTGFTWIIHMFKVNWTLQDLLYTDLFLIRV